MKKEIPEIDTLLAGINDPDAVLSPTSASQEEIKADNVPDCPNQTSPSDSFESDGDDTTEKYWNEFMRYLTDSNRTGDKDDRLVCKLDRDLADSLDDCDIGNRSRSDLVNAILRSFFGTFMPRLIQYRREKKSLFRNYVPS